MVICKEPVGKTVASFTIYHEDADAPEICIEFTDGTVFSASIKTSAKIEAKLTCDEGGRPQVLKDYSVAHIAHGRKHQLTWCGMPVFAVEIRPPGSRSGAEPCHRSVSNRGDPQSSSHQGSPLLV